MTKMSAASTIAIAALVLGGTGVASASTTSSAQSGAVAGGGISASQPVNVAEVVEASVVETETTVTVKYELNNGDRVDMTVNGADKTVTVTQNGEVAKVFTLDEVEALAQQELTEGGNSEQAAAAGSAIQAAADNSGTCEAVLWVLGVANSSIWAAAGVSAVAPPAAIVAGVAGVSTSAVLGLISLMC